MNLEQIRDSIKPLMISCGEIMLNADRESIAIDSKEGHKNFVTTYDKKIQEIIRAGLNEIMPEAVFIGEEDAEHNYNSNGYAFIVDPIDGTSNFMKNYGKSCISIALANNGESVLGMIYDPYMQAMYTAIKGNGAFCNDKPIHVSNSPISEGLVMVGTAPYYAELHDKSFEIARTYFDRCIDIRRDGSAAMDLMSVATGKAEVYCELKIQPWDVAAGYLIVTEAGGIVTAADGKPITLNGPTSVLARNGADEENLVFI